MQTRPTRQLAKKLRAEHRLSRSWKKAADACGVMKPDGQPNKGLAYRIAKRGYEPTRPETRARLGLDKEPERRRRPRSLFDMTDVELLFALANRVEM